jgi:hypothetical protein
VANCLKTVRGIQRRRLVRKWMSPAYSGISDVIRGADHEVTGKRRLLACWRVLQR